MIKYPMLLEKKIGEFFDYKPRKLYHPQDPNKVIMEKDFKLSPIHIKMYEKLLKSMPTLPECPAFIGIEVEVEQAPGEFFHAGWTEDKDGSLRNNGKEYISQVYPAKVVNQQLAGLFTTFLLSHPKPDFSWRTSIHIHLCVRDRTVEEVLKLFLLYLVFERVLFLFADQEREKSVFCVPVTRSSHAEDLAEFFSQKIGINALMKNWHKYAALNLIRMSDYGTLEFRHLSGTYDLKKISNWIGVLLAMYNSAINMPLNTIIEEIKTLNTTSKYMLFRDNVFGKQFGKVLPIPDFDLIAEGISFCKECLSGINQLRISEDSSMMKFVRKEQAKKEDFLRVRPSIAELLDMKKEGVDIHAWLVEHEYLPNKQPGLKKKLVKAPANLGQLLKQKFDVGQFITAPVYDDDQLDEMTDEEYEAALKAEQEADLQEQANIQHQEEIKPFIVKAKAIHAEAAQMVNIPKYIVEGNPFGEIQPIKLEQGDF